MRPTRPRPLVFRLCLTSQYVLTALLLILAVAPTAFSQVPPAGPGLAPIEHYIDTAWDTLTRSMTDCNSVVDPKIKSTPVLYLPAGLPAPPEVEKLHDSCGVDIEHLPIVIHQLGEIDTGKIHPHGLLYLPKKYVVPGGRFNEMYGWDSFFTARGLLRAGRLDLAKGMTENFVFETEYYGAFLNANRTYYLTRSQPPFLSSMVMDVYDAEKKRGTDDKAWLERAYPFVEKNYLLWTRDPHLAGDTGLARYFDFGEGPPAEALQDEGAVYRKVISYFMVHPEQADHYLVERRDGQAKEPGLSYSITICDVATTKARADCEPQRVINLSADYYKGDRSMRESGFDISFRFGAYGAATHHYAAVCLNSLLYKNEKDLERMSTILGKKEDAAKWSDLAAKRKSRIQQYLWDASRGMFFDYRFDTGQRSTYVYASMFYPLWAGVATPEQAKAVEKNLSLLEQPGGVAMSTEDAGVQWDYPYGWAPIQLMVIEGLRNYGFQADANRLSYKFLSMVAENFQHEGMIREKYDVVTRSSESRVQVGYEANVVGFGWTNGVFLELLHALPQEMVEKLDRELSVKASEKPAATTTH